MLVMMSTVLFLMTARKPKSKAQILKKVIFF